MKKNPTKWFLAAGILLALGAVLLAGALAAGGFDLAALSTEEYQTATYTLEEDLQNIQIDLKTASLSILPSEDGLCRVVCFEAAKERHSVQLRDGTLTLQARDERKWYERIGITVQAPRVTLYLPKESYGSLSVITQTGDITIHSCFRLDSLAVKATTGNIESFARVSGSTDLETTTGRIRLGSIGAASVRVCTTTGALSLEMITCGELTAKTATGALRLTDVTADSSIRLQATTGNVTLAGCDAPSITVKTSTGNVSGTLRSGKTFITHTSTGTVKVPPSEGYGECRITTSTGNIRIEIGS